MPKNKLVAPFLKWVGGKRQIMDEIVSRLPQNLNTYVEPFIGGGAVLFQLQPKNAIINDFNVDLINVYQVIKDNLDELIQDLSQHKNDPDYFYEVRGLDRTEKFAQLTNIQKASRLIYLNKTCYNGLYRVNNAGEFNSPYGRYKNPNIVNEPTLRAVSNYLRNNNVQLFHGDYANVLNQLTPNSFVYLDPPYHPISESSNFTGYVQGGWGAQDQIRLREHCDELNRRGIRFLLSNSSCKLINDQYQNYTIEIIKANRSINSDGNNRGEVDEVLIRNYGAVKK